MSDHLVFVVLVQRTLICCCLVRVGAYWRSMFPRIQPPERLSAGEVRIAFCSASRVGDSKAK